MSVRTYLGLDSILMAYRDKFIQESATHGLARQGIQTEYSSKPAGGKLHLVVLPY